MYVRASLTRQCACGGQRTPCESQLSFFTMWILGLNSGFFPFNNLIFYFSVFENLYTLFLSNFYHILLPLLPCSSFKFMTCFFSIIIITHTYKTNKQATPTPCPHPQTKKLLSPLLFGVPVFRTD